jgi:hypothetical protein
MVYNGYYKVMSNIPKMGHLPTPVVNWEKSQSWLVVSTHPSEKYESQLGLLFPIYGKS